jgi:hypothetical protein
MKIPDLVFTEEVKIVPRGVTDPAYLIRTLISLGSFRIKISFGLNSLC